MSDFDDLDAPVLRPRGRRPRPPRGNGWAAGAIFGALACLAAAVLAVVGFYAVGAWQRAEARAEVGRLTAEYDRLGREEDKLHEDVEDLKRRKAGRKALHDKRQELVAAVGRRRSQLVRMISCFQERKAHLDGAERSIAILEEMERLTHLRIDRVQGDAARDPE